jgi:hypothetical protein
LTDFSHPQRLSTFCSNKFYTLYFILYPCLRRSPIPFGVSPPFWSARARPAPYTHLSVSIATAGTDRLFCSGGRPACRSWRHFALGPMPGFQPGSQIIQPSLAGVRFSAGRDARRCHKMRIRCRRLPPHSIRSSENCRLISPPIRLILSILSQPIPQKRKPGHNSGLFTHTHLRTKCVNTLIP